MTASAPTSNIGRHVFGVAALALGLGTLAWQDYSAWHQQRYIAYAAASGQIFRGAVIQFRRTEKGRSRPWWSLSCVYLTVRARNRRHTSDLQ